MKNKFENRPDGEIVTLFENEALIVVHKPAWLLSVPGRGEDKQDSVYFRLAQHYPDLRAVHRLDWATSGVMVFAKHLEAQRHLNKQFAERETHKTYIACVYGKVPARDFFINLPMRCDWERRPRQIVDFYHGKSARTYVEVIDYLASDALHTPQTRLKLTPITGRSHQLRVHCAALGFPIVGDQLYAPQALAEQAPRLLLHAKRLVIKNPVDNQLLDISAPCPF